MKEREGVRESQRGTEKRRERGTLPYRSWFYMNDKERNAVAGRGYFCTEVVNIFHVCSFAFCL